MGLVQSKPPPLPPRPIIRNLKLGMEYIDIKQNHVIIPHEFNYSQYKSPILFDKNTYVYAYDTYYRYIVKIPISRLSYKLTEDKYKLGMDIYNPMKNLIRISDIVTGSNVLNFYNEQKYKDPNFGKNNSNYKLRYDKTADGHIIAFLDHIGIQKLDIYEPGNYSMRCYKFVEYDMKDSFFSSYGKDHYFNNSLIIIKEKYNEIEGYNKFDEFKYRFTEFINDYFVNKNDIKDILIKYSQPSTVNLPTHIIPEEDFLKYPDKYITKHPNDLNSPEPQIHYLQILGIYKVDNRKVKVTHCIVNLDLIKDSKGNIPQKLYLPPKTDVYTDKGKFNLYELEYTSPETDYKYDIETDNIFSNLVKIHDCIDPEIAQLIDNDLLDNVKIDAYFNSINITKISVYSVTIDKLLIIRNYNILNNKGKQTGFTDGIIVKDVKYSVVDPTNTLLKNVEIIPLKYFINNNYILKIDLSYIKLNPPKPIKQPNPIEQVKPLEPIEQVKPLEPIEQVKPLEPIEQVKPLEPIQPQPIPAVGGRKSIKCKKSKKKYMRKYSTKYMRKYSTKYKKI
jgi:hypothetical protein